MSGTACCNLEVEIPGTARPEEIVVVGAHYDTVPGTPGANDNASGVAATLALARRFAKRKIGRTLRFVAFANEEQAVRPHGADGLAGLRAAVPGAGREGDGDAQPGDHRLLRRHARQPEVSAAARAALSLGRQLHRLCRQPRDRAISSVAWSQPSGRTSRSRPRVPPCPRRCPASATRTTARSGRKDIRRSWSRTRRTSAIPTTTRPRTPSTRSTSTGWLGWCVGWRRWLPSWLARARNEPPRLALVCSRHAPRGGELMELVHCEQKPRERGRLCNIPVRAFPRRRLHPGNHSRIDGGRLASRGRSYQDCLRRCWCSCASVTSTASSGTRLGGSASVTTPSGGARLIGLRSAGSIRLDDVCKVTIWEGAGKLQVTTRDGASRRIPCCAAASQVRAVLSGHYPRVTVEFIESAD